jgi:hypothetical protein
MFCMCSDVVNNDAFESKVGGEETSISKFGLYAGEKAYRIKPKGMPQCCIL